MADERKLVAVIGMAAGLGFMGGAYSDEWCATEQQRAPFTTLCKSMLSWDMPHGHNDQRGPKQPGPPELLSTASSTASIAPPSSSGIKYWISDSSSTFLS
jgi:hypothetical protein